MNCAIHQETPVVAYCRTCGKPMCDACKRDVHGVIYCEDCLASRVQGTPTPPGVVNPNAPHPGVAMVLGMIPGVGAMYAGEFQRAFIHVGVFVGLIIATSQINGMFGILIPFWCLYMIFDSYQIAKAKQEGRPVPEMLGFAAFAGSRTSSTSMNVATPAAVATDSANSSSPPPSAPPLIDVDRSRSLPLGPIILIALGVLFLLPTWFHFLHLWKLWPLILLVIGGWLVFQRMQTATCRCVACTAVSMMGPAILITIGVMGLLDEFTGIWWGKSWPLILIVIGVLKFLQVTGSRVGHISPGGVPPATPPSSSQQDEVTHG